MFLRAMFLSFSLVVQNSVVFTCVFTVGYDSDAPAGSAAVRGFAHER